MSSLLPMLGTARDLLLVVLGFTLIIVVHELGHFLAARWAGVRVLAFAVGFGPALLSYRKGMGLRRGSTEAEFHRRVKADPALAHSGAISPTEYRLNALPFGGYVKMLGQDDADPSARNNEPDSFQTCAVWKRMVIISAGVVMNLVLAAALFIVVFMVGLKVQPPTIGAVLPGKPAATAVAVNGVSAGVTTPGLRTGDQVLSVDGVTPLKFEDLILATAMAGPSQPISMVVRREGVAEPLRFEVLPEVDPDQKLQMIGVEPMRSAKLPEAKSAQQLEGFHARFEDPQFEGLEPGMTLVRIDGKPVKFAHDLTQAARTSGGRPFEATVQAADGTERSLLLTPRPEFMSSRLKGNDGQTPGVLTGDVEHLAGLVPVLRVVSAGKNAMAAGLQTGDIFSLLGTVEWPSNIDGILQIRSRKDRSIRAAVVRKQTDGTWKELDLGEVPVDAEGRIGFTAGNSGDYAAFVAGWPRIPLAAEGRGPPSASLLDLMPGSRVQTVAGKPVETLGQARAAILEATAGASEGKTLELVIVLPDTDTGGAKRTETVEWSIPTEELEALRGLSWLSPLGESDFTLDSVVLRASGPVDAVGMGLRETRSVMLTTYLTFARLYQGTVKVTHLRGPVGIAQTGTFFASRGWMWLLFFMALISVNLAVVNFLPIPITDGGHMIFLCYEQFTGRPVSPLVQNVATLAGLALIGSVFLVVTFNDLRNLFIG